MVELMMVSRIVSRAPLLVRRGIRSDDILAFVTGSGGEDVLHALYDHIVEEAVPSRLSEILDRDQSVNDAENP